MILTSMRMLTQTSEGSCHPCVVWNSISSLVCMLQGLLLKVPRCISCALYVLCCQDNPVN